MDLYKFKIVVVDFILLELTEMDVLTSKYRPAWTGHNNDNNNCNNNSYNGNIIYDKDSNFV